jgi:hypothetical protein
MRLIASPTGRPRRISALAALIAAGVIIAAAPRVIRAQQAQTDIAPSAQAQITALLADKAARTPVQRKIDSQLIYAARVAAGQPIANGVGTISQPVALAADGLVAVDIRAEATATLLNQLAAIGMEIDEVSAAYRSIQVRVAPARVEEIAAIPEVVAIVPKQERITSAVPGRRTRVPRDRTALRAAVQQALQSGGVMTNVGSVNSQGDVTHKAVNARNTYGVSGAGVKIGVLSDDVCSLAASQALGDLGPVTVLPGQTGSCPGGDEGTAMLEIVHDLAPNAQLYFATAFTSITSFAQNIRDLRTAGADIIVDDVFYYVEPAFQDGQAPGVVSQTNGGVVIQAVKDVVANGALFFSSAGNSGNLNDGTSGTWEGDFVDGGLAGAPISGFEPARLHSFGGQTYNVLTVASGNPITLSWSDPLGNSANDYDLFVLNSTGTTVIAAATNAQTGTGDDPFELVGGNGIPAGSRIVIVKYTGAGTPANRALHLDVNRGRLSIPTAGQTHGHSAVNSANAFGVAATPAVGPYPNPFNSTNVVETFSSDGPRRIFYNADSTPISPGNVLFGTGGGILLNKPDITAADGVAVTGVGSFPSTFFGTSAAAPHAGAIAALVKSANPGLSATQIRTALINSAINIEAPGIDRDSGVGIIMADTAVASVIVSSPVITGQPSSHTISYKTITKLAVTATGTGLAYQWYRGNSGNTARPISGATSSVYVTPPLISNTKYWVRVSNSAGFVDSATALVTVAFSDSVLSPATPARVAHIIELRERIDAARAARGLSAFNWTDPVIVAGVTVIRAIHVLELRTALQQAYLTPVPGLPAPPLPVYTDPTLLPAVAIVKAVHVNQLRTAVVALEE